MAAIINAKTLEQDKKSIGGGSYGDVFPGFVNVAVKEVKSNNDSLVAEATNLLRAQHPNVIRLYGITEEKSGNKTVYRLVMELAENGSLQSYIDATKGNDLERQNLMLQCAEGVAYLHSLTPLILHRDLKPKNILLTNNERTLKICDFGTARELGTKMTNQTGTYGYMAPEVNTDKPTAYTEKCDVFSFGVILIEMMSELESSEKVFKEMSKPDSYTNVKLKFCNNDVMKDLIYQCIQKDPNMRPSMKMSALLLSLDHSSMKKLEKPTNEDHQSIN